MLRFSISKHAGGAAQGGHAATPAAPGRAPAPDRAAVSFLSWNIFTTCYGCALPLPGSMCLSHGLQEMHAAGPRSGRTADTLEGPALNLGPACRMPVLAARAACLASSCALLLMHAGERLAAGSNARALSAWLCRMRCRGCQVHGCRALHRAALCMRSQHGCEPCSMRRHGGASLGHCWGRLRLAGHHTLRCKAPSMAACPGSRSRSMWSTSP